QAKMQSRVGNADHLAQSLDHRALFRLHGIERAPHAPHGQQHRQCSEDAAAGRAVGKDIVRRAAATRRHATWPPALRDLVVDDLLQPFPALAHAFSPRDVAVEDTQSWPGPVAAGCGSAHPGRYDEGRYDELRVKRQRQPQRSTRSAVTNSSAPPTSTCTPTWMGWQHT